MTNGDPTNEGAPAIVGMETQQAPPEAEAHSTASGTSEPAAPKVVADDVKLRGKSVLLVDSNRQSGESRAKILRTRGVQVDCVVDAGSARARLAAEKYDLILVDPGREQESAESLVQEIRARDSRQLVSFLVGSPLFVAKSLRGGSNPTRPHRPRPRTKPLAAAAETPHAPATAGIDFGQRVREAEAIQDAEAQNKT